ncbi:hypothetical protein KUTeg_022960 [Tegillarca granosa]|uniref:Uncharacterized protein n=1 Tax=Tegillarca granosa TaxID=220873 RepID=A0ABQ9E616_TEGGR|nr:hypothetical protein KUTeg_022960 [Tegillarca granosa]
MYDFNIHTLVDNSGLSILYQTTSIKYVIEKINLNDLSVQSHKTLGNLGTSIRPLLICNKLYVIPVTANLQELTITKAFDLNNFKNRQNYVIKMSHFKLSLHSWIHYNPSSEEIFVGHPTQNSKILKVLKCEYPYPPSNTIDLSRIESTFLWSLVPSEHNHKLHILHKLNSFFSLIDPKPLHYISSMLMKCPPKTCHDSHKKNKSYCRMKSLIISLKIYSNYRQIKFLNKPRKRLHVYFKLQKLLEQQKLSTISSQISSLEHSTKSSFLQLKKQISSFRSSIGTYFHTLAQYDQSTASSDMNLIYSLLDRFQKKSATLSGTVQQKLKVILRVAFASKLAHIGDLIAKVVIAATAFLNPFDTIADASGNILELLAAIDALTKALVDVTRLAKLAVHIQDLAKLMATLGNQIKENGKKYTAIKAMVTAGKKHAITDEAINKYKDKFLKEYDNYQPYYSKSKITKFGALLESITEDLCEILFSGDTSSSNLIQLGFAAKGDCFQTKLDVKYLIALYEDMYDHQESLIDAFASVVRATVAKHNAKNIKTIANRVTQDQVNMNQFYLKLFSLEMFVNSEIHKMIIVHDACNLIEYKNGAKMPRFCKLAIGNPRGIIFNQLIAARFEKDMCADDQISHHVKIPAMVHPLNKKLPAGVIDLNALYSGKMFYFQVPSKTWLVENHWIQSNDANEKLVLKKIELYLPFLQKEKNSSPVSVHVAFKLAGDNKMVPKGTIYDFDIPMEYHFRYKQSDKSCANTLKPYTPYTVLGCRNKYKPPPICVTSAGTKTKSPFLPSVFSNFLVQAYIKGDILRPRPKNIFYLRADVTLCVVRPGLIQTHRKKRIDNGSVSNSDKYGNTSFVLDKTNKKILTSGGSTTNDKSSGDGGFSNATIKERALNNDDTLLLREQRDTKCCFESKQIYDIRSRSCQSCSKGYKPNLYGYYCEKIVA